MIMFDLYFVQVAAAVLGVAFLLPYVCMYHWRLHLQMKEVTETRAMMEEMLFLLAKIEHQLHGNHKSLK